MKRLLALLSLIIPVIIFSCKSTKYTPDDFPERQIIFGSGGGVAGLYNYYYVLENGQAFKKSTTDTAFVAMKNVSKKEIRQIFNTYDQLGLKDYQINNPGNMSYYLTFKQDEKEHQLTWGGGKDVDPRIKTIFANLNALLK